MIKGFSKPWISISLRFRDCGALRVMMESPVYQVSPVSQDLRDIRHTQEWVVHVNIHMYTYMLVATCTGRAGTGQITQNDCSHALETPVKPILCCDSHPYASWQSCSRQYRLVQFEFSFHLHLFTILINGKYMQIKYCEPKPKGVCFTCRAWSPRWLGRLMEKQDLKAC